MNRREFINLSGGAFAIASARTLFGAQPAVSQDAVVEPARSIIVRGSYDIIVADGGPAGIAAAVVAALWREDALGGLQFGEDVGDVGLVEG